MSHDTNQKYRNSKLPYDTRDNINSDDTADKRELESFTYTYRNTILERLHNEYRNLNVLHKYFYKRHSSKYKMTSLLMKTIENEIRQRQGNSLNYQTLLYPKKLYSFEENKISKSPWQKFKTDTKKYNLIKYDDRETNNKGVANLKYEKQTMSEYQRPQSNENNKKRNGSNELNYESKQKEKKINKFEFKDFKPNVFPSRQHTAPNSFANMQQTIWESNNRKTEIRKQILPEDNIPTRNPFSTQRQMPSIPQTHRGNINTNNLYSVFESQPQNEMGRNQTIDFQNMNIERQRPNYMSRGPNQQHVVNSQYMQERVNPPPNIHTNYMMHNSSPYNRNRIPTYPFSINGNVRSMMGDPHSYLRREPDAQMDSSPIQDQRNINNHQKNINFQLPPNEIPKYNRAYPPINSNNMSFSPGESINSQNNPNVKTPSNLQNDTSPQNPILDYGTTQKVKTEKRGRKKNKHPSVETADSLQSLSSEHEKVEKKVKTKKIKVKTYTNFYAKTNLFGPEKVKGYEMSLDPINLFEDYNIFKGNPVCSEPGEGNILEYMNKDIMKRKQLRKITNLLEFLRKTNKTEETEILNEFLGTENSIVSLGFEEIETALKIMFDLK